MLIRCVGAVFVVTSLVAKTKSPFVKPAELVVFNPISAGALPSAALV